MHRCSNNIGCLSVSASKVGQSINSSISLLNEELSVSASGFGKGLMADCSIVCTISKAYLYVDPTILWLTPDMFANADFYITSNTSWNID